SNSGDITLANLGDFTTFTKAQGRPSLGVGPHGRRPWAFGRNTMAHFIRIAAVSYVPPAHDHHKQGVKLDALRETVLKVAKEQPDFICFPEVCACIGAGLKKGVEFAPEIEPFTAAVGQLARE